MKQDESFAEILFFLNYDYAKSTFNSVGHSELDSESYLIQMLNHTSTSVRLSSRRSLSTRFSM